MSPNPALLTWPRPVAAGGALVITHVTDATGVVTAGTGTFSNVDLGPAEDRTVIIVFTNGVSAGGAVSTVTVADVAATIDVQNPTHAASCIARLRLDSGVTSGTIVVKMGTPTAIRASIYSCPDVLTVYDTDSQYVANGTSFSRTLSTPAGGCVFAGVAHETNAGTWTWGGVSADFSWVSGQRSGSVASLNETDGNALTVTATASTAGLFGGMSVAVYS